MRYVQCTKILITLENKLAYEKEDNITVAWHYKGFAGSINYV